MAEHSNEYIEGWKAARVQYQSTGGVQPYPPKPAPSQEVPKGPLGNQPPVKPTRAKKAQGA